ncbi:MAG: phage baseplate assembly protein [Aeromonas veronii]
MSNNPGRAALSIAGQRFEGWTEVSVTHSIEQVASNFTLALTDRWGVAMEPRPIRKGDSCIVSLEGHPLINGYINRSNPGYDAGQRRLSVSGRSKTADLVDCSADIDGGQFKGRSLLQIATALCKPLGVEVVNEVPEAAKPLTTDWQLEPGESVFESLERAARFVRCLLIPDPQGRLVITRAGRSALPVQLVYGENILEADGQYDDSDQFSDYIVLGDSAAGGDSWDELDAVAVTQTLGRVKDDTVRRYRPMVILAEDNLDAARATERAEWEMRRRRARANQVDITVAGWTMPGSNALWPLNHLVPVTCPWLNLQREFLLITALTFTKNGKGTRTTLTLMPKEGFEVEPIAPKKKTDDGGGW